MRVLFFGVLEGGLGMSGGQFCLLTHGSDGGSERFWKAGFGKSWIWGLWSLQRLGSWGGKEGGGVPRVPGKTDLGYSV